MPPPCVRCAREEEGTSEPASDLETAWRGPVGEFVSGDTREEE